MSFLGKLSFTIFITFSPCLVSAQNSLKDFYIDQCKNLLSFQTGRIPLPKVAGPKSTTPSQTVDHRKDYSAKVLLTIPCQWSRNQVQGEEQAIKKFVYETEDSTTIMAIFSMKQIADGYTAEQKKFDISTEGLKKLLANDQNFISGSKLKISGINCGELIFSQEDTSASAGTFTYSVTYKMFYDDKEIVLLYSLAHKIKAITEKQINEYTDLFRSLAKQTDIGNGQLVNGRLKR